jgi:hypothetical protein
MKVRGMRFAVAALAGMVLLAGCGGGEEEKAGPPEEETPTSEVSPQGTLTPDKSSPSPFPATEGESQLKVTLSGNNEVPRPGDTAMNGSGTVTVSTNQRNACPSLTITVPAGQEISAAHIHRGAQGSNGPVVVPFESDAKSVKSDCVMADTNLLREISSNPSGFYVNVHTKRFPDGATRGQLTK